MKIIRFAFGSSFSPFPSSEANLVPKESFLTSEGNDLNSHRGG
jgi:hypothetical protein